VIGIEELLLADGPGTGVVPDLENPAEAGFETGTATALRRFLEPLAWRQVPVFLILNHLASNIN
jgi:hypothetical protein